VENALGAIVAARHVGVSPAQAMASLGRFAGVRRRLEVRGEVNGITVLDDFAHHPTAIAATIDGLRRRVGGARIVAVLEPRSNTMRMGVHRDTLGPSLAAADEVWLYTPPDLGWDVAAAVAGLGTRAHLAESIDRLVETLPTRLRSGDQVLIMSNGGFGGLHDRLLTALRSGLRTTSAEGK
jgi:UDP-N-acetylmuramate: L-alanyl-gamma-D-glutamyl-meso-diaminopimelate ligase